MTRMLRAGEVIEETDEFQFFDSKVWYPCSLIIGNMEKGQTLLSCNEGHYRRPTPRAVDGGQAGENNGQVALPTATNA